MIVSKTNLEAQHEEKMKIGKIVSLAKDHDDKPYQVLNLLAS
jgi:hypothetical protein